MKWMARWRRTFSFNYEPTCSIVSVKVLRVVRLVERALSVHEENAGVLLCIARFDDPQRLHANIRFNGKGQITRTSDGHGVFTLAAHPSTTSTTGENAGVLLCIAKFDDPQQLHVNIRFNGSDYSNLRWAWCIYLSRPPIHHIHHK